MTPNTTLGSGSVLDLGAPVAADASEDGHRCGCDEAPTAPQEQTEKIPVPSDATASPLVPVG